MNCFLKEIFIFDSQGNKRLVPLTQGLNIITGESQTGKSALIEIVDYCLCSSSSTIPQGRITDFAYLFGIILEFKSKFIVLARRKFNEGGMHKMYFKLTTNKEELVDIQLSYFFELVERNIKDDVQIEIEKHLGLATFKIMTEQDDSRDQSKASLRSMTSFLFQHQNLIANKHALFYRFDNSNKRRPTIEQFPILMGWVDDRYFLLKRELDEKVKNLRQIKISEKKQSAIQADQIENLKRMLEDYYAIVGQTLPIIKSFNDIKRLQNELPAINKKSFVEKTIYTQYQELKNERDLLNKDKILIDTKITEIENYQNYANSYYEDLSSLANKNINSIQDKNNEYNCPTCGQTCRQINHKKRELHATITKLNEELILVENYNDSYSVELEKLYGKRESIIERIKLSSDQLEDLGNRIKELKDKRTLNETAIYSKAKIDITIDEIDRFSSISFDKEIKKLESEIFTLQQKIQKFNVKEQELKAELFIAENMNRICSYLDFEQEFKPINWIFKLEDFSLLYRNSKIGDISLSEMGSGSNWLACHLSLFISFQWLFCQEKKCSFPNFLFLDQPSQVYFPKEYDKTKDKDRIQVENIFRMLLDEIERINKEYHVSPQIIITDHADFLDLGKYNFEDYVRRRWTVKNALI